MLERNLLRLHADWARGPAPAAEAGLQENAAPTA